MATSNLPVMPQMLKPFIYGFLTCIIALLIREAFLTEEIRYTSNWTAYLVLLVLCSGAFVYFKHDGASLTSISQLFQSSLIFGIAAGFAIGLFYYITVTILDTDYLQKSLDAAHKSWAARGYSKEAIGAQVELTDTFQHPLKWSLTLTLFYFLVTAGLSFIMGGFARKHIPSDAAHG